MTGMSRRALLAGASLGAAAAGAAAVAGPLAAHAKTGSTEQAAPAAAALREPVVARVTDVKSGTVELFVGERQVTVHDAALASHLARAAQA